MATDHWGTFDAIDGNVHVAPCDEDGDVTRGHMLSTCCPCGPEIERRIGARPLVIHDEPEDGPEVETRH